MVTERSLPHELILAINLWLKANRKRNLSSLARRTNIAYSTIRRMVQTASVPHPFTALAIAEVVLPVPERTDFLKRHFPTIGNLMDACDCNSVSAESFRRFIRLEPHNRIFNMAATHAGTNRSTIQRLAGEIGLVALDEMIRNGMLVEDASGSIRYPEGSWAFTSSHDALVQIQLSVNHFNQALLGTSGASLMHATGAVHADVVPRLKALITNFIQEFMELKNAKDSEGNIPFFCDLVYSLYDPHDWRKDHEPAE